MSAEPSTSQQPTPEDNAPAEHGSDQGDTLSPIRPQSQPSIDAIQYTRDWIKDFKARGDRDYGLWVEFGEAFPRWTEEMFEKRLDMSIRRMLRETLRKNGVYVPITRFVAISKTLEIVANEQKQAEWPQRELDEESLRGGFNSWRNT
jgi:hypothetical protein